MKQRFTGDVRAPAHARLFVTSRLDDLVSPDEPVRDDIILIVSELVTNSVRAGAATIDVRLVVDAEQVEVDVTDDAPGWPTPRDAGGEDRGGRGLSLVDKLSDAWRVVPAGSGKTVAVSLSRRRTG